ncbi:MAG: diguanylate cyclase [Terriglobales bacterium]
MAYTSKSRLSRVLGGLLLASAVALAQMQSAPRSLSFPDNPRFTSQRFGEQFGIGVVTVTAMAQDQNGFLWIGTQTGLFRYDGSRVTRMTAAEPLVGHYLDLVLIAPDNSVWVGGFRGVARYSHDQFTALAVPEEAGKIPNSAEGVAVDRQGNAFVVVEHGLLRANPQDPSKTHLFGKADGVDCKTEVVVAGADDSIWFTCGHRLARLAPGAERPEWDTNLQLPRERAVALIFDGAGELWLRSCRHVARIDRVHHQLFYDDAGIAPANQEGGKPSLDQDGSLLVPSMAGLFWRDQGHWRKISAKDGLSSNNVQIALQDREGTLWVGGYGTGLDHLTGIRDWSAWTKAEGLPDNATWATERDRDGRLWVATPRGIGVWDGQRHQWKTLTARDGLSGTETRELELAADGSIWAIALPGGITRIDPHSFRTQRFTSFEGENFIYEIADPHGDIWATTGKKLVHFDGRSPVPHPEGVRLPDAAKGEVWYLDISPTGVLWACAPGRLLRFDGKRWRLFTRTDGLSGDSITSLAAVRDDEVWIGYDDVVGITRFELDSSGQPHIERYPWDLNIIGKDSKHRVWFNGIEGIRVFAPGGTDLRFSQADGLIWDDISPSGFREEPDGSFLISTTNGLARYVPHATAPASAPPGALITSVSFGDQDVSVDSHPQRDYKHGSLHVQFTPLVLNDSADVTCRYRLAGLDDRYVESNLREVLYSSLPPGQYQFGVQCRNEVSAWSPEIARFSFTILPPWWQTIWFRGAIVWLALGLIWLIVRVRTYSLNRRRRELEEAVVQRSAELLEKNRELEEISLTDPLTRARNRRYFYETIPTDTAHVLRQYRGFSAEDRAEFPSNELIFVMVDIDFFKIANDEHGHLMGDRLIQEIANRLSDLIRKSDVLVRWGGEEFLIVCRSTDRSHAPLFCSRILETISAVPYRLEDGAAVTLTCSVGWAPFPWIPEAVDALTLENVIEIADRALYVAKKTGRNQGIGLIPSAEAMRAPYEVRIETLRKDTSRMADIVHTENPRGELSKSKAASAAGSIPGLD